MEQQEEKQFTSQRCTKNRARRQQFNSGNPRVKDSPHMEKKRSQDEPQLFDSRIPNLTVHKARANFHENGIFAARRHELHCTVPRNGGMNFHLFDQTKDSK